MESPAQLEPAGQDTARQIDPEKAKEIARKALAIAKASGLDWKKWLTLLLTLIGTNAATSTSTYYAMRAPAPGPGPDGPMPEIVVKDVSGRPHERIELKAETVGVKVRWRADPGILLIDDLPDLILNKRAVAIGCKPGKFRVECWSAIGNEPTAIYVATVTVSGEPGPGPTPPDPPTPVPPVPPVPPPPVPPIPPPPPPPAPVDPFLSKLQAAYDADRGAEPVKRGQLSLMIGLYLAMVDHSKDASIKTTGDLLADYKRTANGDGTRPGLLLPNELIGLRKLIGAEVAAVFGPDSVTLDDPMRTRAVELWGKLAKTLGAIK